ncbi:MAG: L,D-transpeptidase family protein [Rhodospirillales bacterium]|nr:L,D-transpeptidase family protein [Rhodospirillales bacterium]
MDIIVTSPTELHFLGKSYGCAVGRSGFTVHKHEGDGATPVGRFRLRQLRYRADRLEQPETRLTTCALTLHDGWCDAPDHAQYNRPVPLPFGASHETLWRSDNLYNLIVDLGYNDNPPVAGRGSAIFLHVADPRGKPTEGCVAVDQADLLEVLANCGPETHMDIMPHGL